MRRATQGKQVKKDPPSGDYRTGRVLNFVADPEELQLRRDEIRRSIAFPHHD